MMGVERCALPMSLMRSDGKNGQRGEGREAGFSLVRRRNGERVEKVIFYGLRNCLHAYLSWRCVRRIHRGTAAVANGGRGTSSACKRVLMTRIRPCIDVRCCCSSGISRGLDRHRIGPCRISRGHHRTVLYPSTPVLHSGIFPFPHSGLFPCPHSAHGLRHFFRHSVPTTTSIPFLVPPGPS